MPTTEWIGLVPLRAGSKGLIGKNTKPLAGKPLYRHAVDQGLAAGAAHIYLSTDINSVIEQDHGPQVSAVSRPASLATDTTPMDAVLSHFLRQEFVGNGLVVLLQATSPLRTAADIEAALTVYAAGEFDLVMSVTPTDAGILKYGTQENGRFVPVSRPEYCFRNRQDLPQVFRPNGAVYVFSSDWFRANGSLATDRIGMVEMPNARSLDIDTQSDFDRVEAILTNDG